MDLLKKANDFLHNFKFVMYSEHLYNLKLGETGPISKVQAKLKSWWTFLPPDLKPFLDLGHFYEEPYRKLAEEYTYMGKSKLLRYLCLFKLGDGLSNRASKA